MLSLVSQEVPPASPAELLSTLADTARLAALAMVACSDADRPAAREPRAADLMELRTLALGTSRACLEALASHVPQPWEVDRWRLAVELADIPSTLFDAACLLHAHPQRSAPAGVAQLAHLVLEAVTELPLLVGSAVHGEPDPEMLGALHAVKAAHRHAERIHNLRVTQIRAQETDRQLAAEVVEMLELLRHATDLAAAAAELAGECWVMDGTAFPPRAHVRDAHARSS